MGGSVIDKTALIGKIKQLEGLTDEEKSNLIGLLRQHKKYGLVWEDKPEDVEERLREELPVLKEVKERALISDQPDAPNHILIEGDNLEALTALSYTHEGKIDVIYIDPPYNTGNKDFAYYDDFCDDYRKIPYVDREDAFRHSKWLSFMNRRLRIAKRLLSDKGVIFISIDDNEQAALKLLCDDVFGISSYVSTLTIESSVIAGPRRVPAMQGSIVKTAEYCLIYTRREDTKIMANLKFDFIDGFDTHYNKWVDEESNKIISLTELIRKNQHVVSAFEKYKLSISTQNFGKILLLDDGIKQWLYSDQIASYLYRQGDKEYDVTGADNMPNNHLFKVNSKWYVKSNGDVYNVFRYIDRIGQCDDYFNSFGERTVRGNLWKGFSSDGGNLEKEGGVSFKSGKKPIRLIKQFLDSINLSKYSIILDFFAGSGTTMEAVMQLNKGDGGYRQCILITNNEGDICEKTTYKRIKNVINGYGNQESLHNNNLRYYQTDFISRERTQHNMRALTAAATDLLCIKENLYDEQTTFGRFKLRPNLARYFNDGTRHMLIIYHEELVDEIVEEIKRLKQEGQWPSASLMVYIFSPGRYAFNDNFFEVQDSVQLVALPAAIYDAYQRVLPKRKEKLLDEAEPKAAVSETEELLDLDFEEGGEQ